MKIYRNTFPKVRSVEVNGSIYYEVDFRKKGKGGQKRFSTLELAKSFADEYSKEFESGLIISDEEKRLLITYRERLKSHSKTIWEILEGYLSNSQIIPTDITQGSLPVSELATKWNEFKNDPVRLSLKPLKPATLKDIKYAVNHLKYCFGSTEIKKCNSDMVEKYLAGQHNLSALSKRNVKNLMSQFFNWCKKENYTNINIIENVEQITVKRIQPKILLLSHAQELINKCATSFPELMPVVSIGMFAGLRPTEIEHLKLHDFKLTGDNKNIYVGVDAKIKTDRYVPIKSNLETILKKYGYNTQPSGLRRKFDLLKKSLSFKWEQDILRHTYGSYLYSEMKSYDSVSHIMGNSPTVCKKFYVRAIDPNESKSYFSILPK